MSTSNWIEHWADSKLGACVKLAANVELVTSLERGKVPGLKLDVVVGESDHDGKTVVKFANVEFDIHVRNASDRKWPTTQIRLPAAVKAVVHLDHICVSSPAALLVQMVETLQAIQQGISSHAPSATEAFNHFHRVFPWDSLAILGHLHSAVKPYFYDSNAPQWTKVPFGPEIVAATVGSLLSSHRKAAVHKWLGEIIEATNIHGSSTSKTQQEKLRDHLRMMEYFIEPFEAYSDHVRHLTAHMLDRF
ncbi:hypothetical protein JCM3766R1_001351 [Sporobolomyces carnicolor]